MRSVSRELLVGFLLVLALAAVGCQPVPPVSGQPATPTEAVGVTEGDVITETATLSESVPVSVSAAITETVAVTETGAATETSGSAPLDPALIEAGLGVYRAQYCGVCHTVDAAETRGTFGPPHNGMGATAAARLTDGTYQGAATTPAEYVRESIVDPQAFIVPGYATTSHRMPAYSHLDAMSLDALVAFLLAQ